MWVTQAKGTKALTYETPTMAGRSTKENSSFSTCEWDLSLWHCCVSATRCHLPVILQDSAQTLKQSRMRIIAVGQTVYPWLSFHCVVRSWQFFARISHPKRVSYFLSLPVFLLHFLLCECDLTQKNIINMQLVFLIRLVSSLTLLQPYSNQWNSIFLNGAELIEDVINILCWEQIGFIISFSLWDIEKEWKLSFCRRKKSLAPFSLLSSCFETPSSD